MPVVRSPSPVFRHKQTGQLFFNAGTQTSKPVSNSSEQILTRETQTVVNKKSVIQTERESGTQTPTPGFHVTDPMDIEIQPRSYETSDQFEVRKINAAIIIQKYFRGYCSRKLYSVLKQVVYNTITERELLSTQKLQDEKKIQSDLLQRRLNPMTLDDFALVRQDVEDWYKKEVLSVKNDTSLDKNQKLQKLRELSMKHIELLQSVDKRKAKASEHLRQLKIDGVLNKLSKPRKLVVNHGTTQETVEVVTLGVQKSQDLVVLYRQLTEKPTNVDLRLELLLKVKTLINQFACNLTHELSDLIDREADLINRDRPSKALTGLRLRISDLFLMLIQLPQFNPSTTAEISAPIEDNSRPLSSYSFSCDTREIEL
ncbi:hypothetical protein RCL1_003776 [Eukaryota sp. TZLM3-RCL]